MDIHTSCVMGTVHVACAYIMVIADAVHMACLRVVEVEAEIFLGEDRGYLARTMN